MASIFFHTESFFRRAIKKSNQRKIDIQWILEKTFCCSTVITNMQYICSTAEMKIERHVAKDLLFSIVKLYIRVRSFSHARYIVQKYKITNKHTKAKGLRKGIIRSSNTSEK